MQNITGEVPPVLGTLREAYRIAREVIAGLPVTGRKWERPPRECPPWCAGGHRCTAQHGYPSGEHRSISATLRSRYGWIVASRTQPIDGATQLDLSVRVNLDPNEDTALTQGVTVPLVVNEAIKACLAEIELMRRRSTKPAARLDAGRQQLPQRIA